eukprot:3641359-Amphidinium_carterae.1
MVKCKGSRKCTESTMLCKLASLNIHKSCSHRPKSPEEAPDGMLRSLRCFVIQTKAPLFV